MEEDSEQPLPLPASDHRHEDYLPQWSIKCDLVSSNLGFFWFMGGSWDGFVVDKWIWRNREREREYLKIVLGFQAWSLEDLSQRPES
jgi:hypothetical protein